MSEEAATPGPGGVLRATRESLRYTRQDVADALNLTVRVVEDLETEQWQKFHAVTFARGYVRAYARLLNLDPDAVLRDYQGFRQPDEIVERTTSPLSSVFESRGAGLTEALQRQPGAVLSGAVAVTVGAIGIVLLLVWPDAPPPADLTPKTPATLSMPPPLNRGGDAQAPTASLPPPVVDAASEADARTIAIPPATVEPGAEPASDVVEPAPQTVPVLASSTPPAARRITTTGDDRLELSFTGDCWVEIKDESGRNLYSDLSRAGASLSLIGAPPFRVLLGNGTVVTVVFNGEPVPLAAHTRNNVTSLVVGARSSNP